MVSIPTVPTITCSFGSNPVAVVTTYKGGLLPISGTDVEFREGLQFLQVPRTEKKTTNIVGLAESCKLSITYVEVWVKKSGIDFGNGVGNWKMAGGGRHFSPTLYKQEATTLAPGLEICTPPKVYNALTGKCETPVIPTLPCTGNFIPDTSAISELIYGIPAPLTTLSVPIRLTGSRTSVPVRILVDGREVDRRTTGFSGIDAIRVLGTAGADINISHTITIESLATDCTIPPLTINIPTLKPTGLPTSIVPIGCSQIITTVETLNHQSEITDFNSTFYVYIRGVKDACRDNPSDPEFIKKVPNGTKGTITLGNLSTDFFINDGVADLDLSKLINLKSLAGAAAMPTLPPISVIQPPPSPPPILKKPCPAGSPNTRFRDAGTSLAAVQAYLPPGYIAEPTAFGGAGTFKITRPNRTYFYAQSCSDIDSILHYGER